MNLFFSKNYCVITINTSKDYNIYSYKFSNHNVHNLIILDKTSNYKTLNITNINIKNLYIYVSYSKIKLTNTNINKIVLKSEIDNSLVLNNNNCINTIYLESKNSTSLYISNPITNTINNIKITNKKYNNMSSDIFLFGNFKNCNLIITTNISLTCGIFFISNPITVDIDEKDSFIILGGNFNNSEINLLNCNCIQGSTLNILKNISINIIPKLANSNISLKGNLKYSDIKAQNNFNLILKTNYIKKLTTDKNCNINLYPKVKTSFDLLGLKGILVLYGNFCEVYNILKQAILLKNTGKVKVDVNNNALVPLVPITKCINKILLYFINEKDNDITINNIRSLCNIINSKVFITIDSLVPISPYSDMFTLDANKSTLLYKKQSPNINNINSHLYILYLKLSYNNTFMYKKILIKAKYDKLILNYNSSQCIVGNDLSALNYSLNQNFVDKLLINENITIPNYTLNFKNKKLELNLNNHSFLLNNISIVDSNIKIKNGTLIPTNDSNLWYKKETKYNIITSFIKLISDNFSSNLSCKNINIKSKPLYLGEKSNKILNNNLFDIGNDNSLNLTTFSLNNSNIEFVPIINNPDDYVINSVASYNNILDNTFINFTNCIKISSICSCLYSNLILSNNDFSKTIKKDNCVLTLIPHSYSKGIITNNTSITNPNLNQDEMTNNLSAIGDSIISTLNNIKPNLFTKNSVIKLFKNEKNTSYAILYFNVDSWTDFVTPLLIADTTKNDMSHFIDIHFTPKKNWSDNITSIQVLNTSKKILTNEEFDINPNLGIISIKNIKFDNSNTPVYQGILEPGDNSILIESTNYETAKLVQDIKPIQLIRITNGVGTAITRIKEKGPSTIEAVLLDETLATLGDPIVINII